MAVTPSMSRRAASATHRIVIGVHGSKNANAAWDWAAAHSQRTGAVLEIVTAFGSGYVFVTPSEAKQAMQKVIDEAAARAERIAPGISIADKTYQGSPDVALVGENTEADLLVAGSRAVADSAACCSALSVDSAYIAHDAPWSSSAGTNTTLFQPKPAGPRPRSGPGPARSSLQRRQP